MQHQDNLTLSPTEMESCRQSGVARFERNCSMSQKLMAAIEQFTQSQFIAMAIRLWFSIPSFSGCFPASSLWCMSSILRFFF
jgi:hypothetical protein